MDGVSENRLEWLDAVKGLGIILVIIGHCDIPGVNRYIYMFHMPLFFIISGFCWNELKYKGLTITKFLKKKFKAYIIPYLKIALICFFLLGVIGDLLLKGYNDEYLQQLAKYIVGIFILSKGNTEWLPHCSPIWFLTCLFCAEVFYWVICRCKHSFILVILAGISGALFSYNHIQFPWNIHNALTAVPLLYIGSRLKLYLNEYRSLYIILPLTILAVCVFVFGLKGGDFDGNYFPSFTLMYVQSSIITLAIFLTFQRYGGG